MADNNEMLEIKNQTLKTLAESGELSVTACETAFDFENKTASKSWNLVLHRKYRGARCCSKYRACWPATQWLEHTR